MGHAGSNNLDIEVNIGRSTLDSRSGTVGGFIELQELSIAGKKLKVSLQRLRYVTSIPKLYVKIFMHFVMNYFSPFLVA